MSGSDTESQLDRQFTLAGSRTGNAVVISGEAIKVPYRSISDIPGPVTVLGLVPSDEGRRSRMMDRAYIFKRFDAGNPAPVFALSEVSQLSEP
jgi:hypothetical protein